MATSAQVSEVRAWAKTNGFAIGDRGRLPAEVWDAWSTATQPANKRPHRPAQAEPAPSSSVDQAELHDARERIARLEAQLGQLASRLATVEEQAHAQRQARGWFTRNR